MAEAADQVAAIRKTLASLGPKWAAAHQDIVIELGGFVVRDGQIFLVFPSNASYDLTDPKVVSELVARVRRDSDELRRLAERIGISKGSR